MLQTLKDLRVRVGVSLDGDAEATGRHRRYANGSNSFDAVAEGLSLLDSPEFRDCYGGILCTIDIDNDPVATYEALLKFNPPALDILLPHANWSFPPPSAGYADWLIAVFERWYSAPRQETRIRLFSELIQLIFGQRGTVEGLGLQPSTLIVVDTDGSIKQLDSLSSTYSGAADTGLHVASSSFDDALDHPTTVARQIGADALSPLCRACPVMEVCGGGLYPHRYQHGVGFRNRSVYCDDLLQLITYVRERVIADLSGLSVLSVVRLDFRSKTGPACCCPRLGMLHTKCLLITAEYFGESQFRGGPVSCGGFINGKICPRHQGVRMKVAECPAALFERFMANSDRVAKSSARSKIRGEINACCQREWMLTTVNPD